MIEHGFDMVICLLLGVTIVHLALVQHRLQAFRAERDRLQAFVTALDLTVERAEAAIRRLKAAQAEGEPAAATAASRTVSPRTPERLLATAAASRAQEARTKAAAENPAAAVPGDGKGGLAELLRSVAGGPS